MGIKFIDITPAAPKQRVRTANDVAPLDCQMANSLSRKIPPDYRDNYRDMPKRGRPPTGKAMTAAERQRRCRERKRQSGG